MEVLKFANSQALTLGVEVEIQLLNNETLDLYPISPKILEICGNKTDKIKAEIFQSMLEVNTGICKNAHEVKKDLNTSVDFLKDICRDLNVRLASSGTHPFALYNERILYPAQRYLDLIDRNQWIARRLMIFGVHIHIGMRNGEHAIQMNNALIHYLPMLLALSASSPYWHGEDTELASSRITFFEALPTGGHPCQVNSWDEYVNLYQKLLKSESIRSPKDIWWDIRLSPSFGTVEIRICDGLATIAETCAITALVHALSIYIDQQIQGGRRFAPPPDWIMRENKWRASRWGIDSKLIINDQGDTANLKKMVRDLIGELKPIIQEEQYENEIQLIEEILNKGPSYIRQRQFAQTAGRTLKDITDFISQEFEANKPLW